MDLRMSFDRDLLETDVLDRLQRILAELSRSWLSGCQLIRNEDEPGIHIETSEKGALTSAVLEEAERIKTPFVGQHGGDPEPPPQRSALVEFRGAEDFLDVFVGVSERAVRIRAGRRWDNWISLKVRGKTVRGVRALTWSRTAFMRCARDLGSSVGSCSLSEEWWSKRMVETDEATYAARVDELTQIPGLFWLNAFGPYYVDLVGKDKLLTAPAHSVEEVDGTIVLTLAEQATEWKSDAYRATEAAVRKHLGEELVFSK